MIALRLLLLDQQQQQQQNARISFVHNTFRDWIDFGVIPNAQITINKTNISEFMYVTFARQLKDCVALVYTVKPFGSGRRAGIAHMRIRKYGTLERGSTQKIHSS